MATRTRPPADVDLPIVAAFTCRDLLDEIAYDDDIPVYRRNEARQADVDFDTALTARRPGDERPDRRRRLPCPHPNIHTRKDQP